MNKIMLALPASLVLWQPVGAFAALGEPMSSVNADKAVMRAAVRPTETRARFTLHQFVTPAGTNVREYAAADGLVFAVTWEGPVMPALRELLGKYFPRYEDATRIRQGSHRHAGLRTDDVVVQSSGHVRAFSGRAYLPQAIPAGVSLDELK